MRVKYLDPALDDMSAILDWIARDSPAAAHRTAQRIREEISHLADHPGMGRSGRVAGTRELVLNKGRHIAAYRVRGQVVEIIAVLSASQAWPENFADRID